MRFVDRSGLEIEAVMPAGKTPRGRQLSDAEVRQHRDMWYCFLVGHGGLSPADALRVINLGASKALIYRRMADMDLHVPDLMAQLLGRARGSTHHAG